MKKLDRKTELIKIVCKDGNESLLLPLVEQTILIEKQLDEISKLPFFKVNPCNCMQQKTLPAFKMYKELLQQYTNVIKTLCTSIGQNENVEESPL